MGNAMKRVLRDLLRIIKVGKDVRASSPVNFLLKTNSMSLVCH